MLHLLQTAKFFIQSGGGHEGGSVSDVIVHHLADSVITTGIIGKINEQYLSTKLFGIFDMRITKWVLTMWVVAILCLIIFIPLAKKIKKAKNGSKSKWVNLWEVLIAFIHDDIVASNFDPPYDKKAMPYMCTVFFYILLCNLIGLIPGSSTATGNLAVTCGLSVITLMGIISVGTVKQGPLWIITGIVPKGIPIALFPLMWVLEFVGLLIKTFALTIRLFANMIAGHIVIIMFILLAIMFHSIAVGVGSVFGALMIYFLELLVAFIQAYIFTMLSAMFIGASIHAH